MFGMRPLSPRAVLIALAFFWTAGAVLLVAAWRSGIAEDRARNAPVCAAERVFAKAECQATLNGTVTAMTHYRLDLQLADRAVSARIAIVGNVDGNAGVPVRVTFYRGEIIHVQGDRIRIDTEAAPATSHENLRNSGLFLLIGGTMMAAVNLAIGPPFRRVG